MGEERGALIPWRTLTTNVGACTLQKIYLWSVLVPPGCVLHHFSVSWFLVIVWEPWLPILILMMSRSGAAVNKYDHHYFILKWFIDPTLSFATPLCHLCLPHTSVNSYRLKLQIPIPLARLRPDFISSKPDINSIWWRRRYRWFSRAWRGYWRNNGTY